MAALWGSGCDRADRGRNPDVLPASQVAELIEAMVKALRAFQIYLPNNPIYQRAIQNVRAACAPIWAATDELVLKVAESEFSGKSRSSTVSSTRARAWPGACSRTACGADHPAGCRGGGAAHCFWPRSTRRDFSHPMRATTCSTLLWAHEFEFIEYRFIDFFTGEGGGRVPQASARRPVEGRLPASEGAKSLRKRRREPKSLVDDRRRRLHALLPGRGEISYLARELEEEYQRDVRGSALNVLFDLLELNSETGYPGRDPAGSSSSSFPNLLNARDFRSAAAVLRESKLLRDKAVQLQPDQPAARGLRHQVERARHRGTAAAVPR